MHCTRYDVRYIAIGNNVDTARGDNEFTPLRNWFNEFYAHDLSKKIRAVKLAKAQRGERANGDAPYGYIINPEKKHHLIPDPETASVVKQIFASEMAQKRIATRTRPTKADGIDLFSGLIYCADFKGKMYAVRGTARQKRSNSYSRANFRNRKRRGVTCTSCYIRDHSTLIYRILKGTTKMDRVTQSLGFSKVAYTIYS